MYKFFFNICIYVFLYTYVCKYLYIYVFIYISISMSISISASMSISIFIFTYVYRYMWYVCKKSKGREQAVTRAGVLASAIRPTETPCGISSRGVASSQFRGPGLRRPTLWLGLGLIASTNWVGYLLTPMWTLQQHDGGVPKLLNPHVDAQTIDV